MPLTVACFKWGNWCAPHGTDYVNRLFRHVQDHLQAPHDFICFTDDPTNLAPGITARTLGCADWNWNLRKMWAYNPASGLKGRVLLLDLDTLVTGSLDDIAAYSGPFCVAEDFFEPGRHGGGVISFEASQELTKRLWEPLVSRYESINAAVNGSERFYFRRELGEWGDHWQKVLPGQVVSSKVHCRSGVPPDARLVCFHGQPRPHQVNWDPSAR